jgi:MoxR-like ATPase
MDARSFVVPDDVKSVALAVLRHRLVLSADAELDGRNGDDLLEGILESTAAPRA